MKKMIAALAFSLTATAYSQQIGEVTAGGSMKDGFKPGIGIYSYFYKDYYPSTTGGSLALTVSGNPQVFTSESGKKFLEVDLAASAHTIALVGTVKMKRNSELQYTRYGIGLPFISGFTRDDAHFQFGLTGNWQSSNYNNFAKDIKLSYDVKKWTQKEGTVITSFDGYDSRYDSILDLIEKTQKTLNQRRQLS